MKKLIAIALFTNAILLAGRFCQEMAVSAEGAGEGAAVDCTDNPTCYGADANNDGAVDVSDPVYLLSWLFLGGPEPQVCFAQPESPLPPEQAQILEDLAFGRRIAAVWVSDAGDLASLTADGTYSDSDIDDFQNEHDGYDSPTRGTWRRNTDGSITLTTVKGRFNADGVLVDIVKDISRIEFNGTFDEATGTTQREVFGPQQVFHTCNAEPRERSGPFEFRAWKLCAEES